MLDSKQIIWPRYIGWARITLAVLAPIVARMALPGGVSLLYYSIMALYAGYAIVVALRDRSQTGLLGLLALFGDTVFFLIMASFGADRFLWFATGYYLFLLTEALVFYSTVQVVVIVAVSSLFCLVVPNGADVLVRPVLVASSSRRQAIRSTSSFVL